MAMRLVIVESPNKTAKISKYLGPGYEVLATAGHFRDLPKRELGVDLASLLPTYVIDDEKKSIVSKLRAAASRAEEVLLATDPDREGEAISWHLAQALGLRNGRRIRFTEITEKALKAAVAAAGPVDQHLVDAQQARRVLDRLVGFQVSPLLVPYFGSNNSAGRVQSATLHLVVVRELAREAFIAKPYWTLAAKYENGLTARYATVDEKGALTEARLDTEAAAIAVEQRAKGPHCVKDVKTEPVERKPKAPFVTSSLQQAASVALGIKPDETMRLAQRLFEAGAITYHRTDSTALSDEAIEMARAFIAEDYPEALPAQPPRYAQKANAQGAHEAIRPTSLTAIPAGLTAEEAGLYELIRQRFVACQCKPAVFDQTIVRIESGDTSWLAKGSVVRFPSFLRYLAKDEDSESAAEGDDVKIPRVELEQVLAVTELKREAKKTQPPPRFTEATLIKEMERQGIGRPSTYANTVAHLFERKYLDSEKKFVIPTRKGRLIDAAVAAGFDSLVDVSYTARMEARLDEIADGKRDWRAEIREWYGGFVQLLEGALPKIAAVAAAHPELAAAIPEAPQQTHRNCPSCTKPLVLRNGPKGAFLACTGYPACNFLADPEFTPFGVACPECGKLMIRIPSPKFGDYARCVDRTCKGRQDLSAAGSEPCPVCEGPTKDKGAFLSCASYPLCRGAWDKKALTKARKLGKQCPACKRRLLREVKGANGTFLGCSGYPSCKYSEAAAEKLARAGKAVKR